MKRITILSFLTFYVILLSAQSDVDVVGDINIGANNAYKIDNADFLFSKGNQGVMVGLNAGPNTTAGLNTFVGNGAGFTNSTGAANSFFGVSSGSLNDDGSNNSFYGVSPL